MTAWRHATLALYRTLLPDNQRHAVSSWWLHSLCVCLGIPHPDSLVSVARRQVFDHLAHADNGGLKLLMDELRHELSWVEAVRRDLRRAAQSGYFDSELVEWAQTAKTSISCARRTRKALGKNVPLMHPQ